MKNHKRLLVFQWKYTKTPMSKFECFGHAVKGQCYKKDRIRVKLAPHIITQVYITRYFFFLIGGSKKSLYLRYSVSI